MSKTGKKQATLVLTVQGRRCLALAGWSIDSLEAQAFAYFAVRSLRGLPIKFTTKTGVPHPLTGGVSAKP
jgi:1,6-anhydro-N-acetylmuramate kinase